MDHTFFDAGRMIVCPLCGNHLNLQARKSDPKSMMLVHPEGECERSGMAYYGGAAISIQLTSVPKEFQ